MQRRTFIQRISLTLGAAYYNTHGDFMSTKDSIQLLRHATLVLTMGEKRILIDPMLSPKGTMDPVANCGNDVRIPMVDLPISEAELRSLLTNIDAVFVTHTHRDHWDQTAQHLIDKDMPVFCQPSDAEKIRQQGFTQVTQIDEEIEWEGLTISRTGGRHGTGEIGQKMGAVSGFVFRHKAHTVYVAGDSIWCEEVADALTKHKPEVIVLNAGAAKFLTGDPITMTPEDVAKVQRTLPRSKVIAVHMDTVNHCFVRRTDLVQALKDHDVTGVLIPPDGGMIYV